jgi:hypothetical protein
MKKQVRRDNRRRKKTIAQQKADRTRNQFWFDEHLRIKRDERKFLLDVLQPVEAVIAQTLAPHLPTIQGDDYDEVYEETIEYALDLIFDNEDEDDPYASVIRDVWRDGAEAALPHLESAIQWRLGFEAKWQAYRNRNG